ncbi:hypothetical protein Mapa_006703 [Marchantia paleacea]|nr:hypothetical protein Mapa_006703 [Marchantia paleacea]
MVADETGPSGLESGNGSVKQRRHGDQDATNRDAGALFVLESKGTWKHAGFHLSSSIAAPPLLTLPFAFVSLGWEYGVFMLVLGAAVTFYAYNLLSKVLEHLAEQGRRHLRFRDLATDILGPTLSKWVVYPTQLVVCIGVVIASPLLGGISIKIIYKLYSPDGDLKLYDFIIIFGVGMIFVGQLPSFHSLRYINFLSLVMTLLYSFTVAGACIYLGNSDKAPPKDYSLPGSETQKVFGAFNSLAIIATSYGNGIIPEIQATLEPPVTGKMFKGLLIAYAVVISTFFTVAISGYWAFGNLAAGSIFTNFLSADGTPLVPKWLIVLPNVLCIAQLLSVSIIYCQPTFDLLEGKSADVEKGRFSARNWIPRLFLRTTFLCIATLIGAMFPFFGDVNAVIGAFGFTPLDFVFPMLFYILVFKPPKCSIKFWGNLILLLAYTVVGVVGAIAAIRQLVLDTSYYKLFADI